ncbi:Oligo-1,6-glucosidase [Cellulomonas sp. T2.31MG-18]
MRRGFDGGVVSTEWWRNATVYQVYPLSFMDSDGDGMGDLRGIVQRLDHLAGGPSSLGVDAIWLSPIYRSPMVDFGYDVADHCDVDPRFGTLADAEHLVEQAHRRRLRVLLDYVPNHTSDQHPWFEQARSSRDDPYRDFYVWRDPAPDGGPPTNWLSAFARVGPAWTLDPTTGQYYLHSYTAEQPDLDWRNPAVREAMHQVLRFWLDRGVDGFRIDAPHRLGKDALLRDNPADVAHLRIATQLDDREHRSMGDPFVHDVLRGIRAVVDEYPGTVLVGEVGVHHPVRRLAYHGSGDELPLVFDFGFWSNPWSADAFRAGGEQMGDVLAVGGWPTHALSNHDIPRHATRYALRQPDPSHADEPHLGASNPDPSQPDPRTRVAAVMLTTLPGATFLYYGEEIGMTDVPVPAELATDPNGRDPLRTPMQWDLSQPDAGFTTGHPWRPVPAAGLDVATQASDPGSLLSLYRDLLRLRRTHPCLVGGDYAALDAGPEVYAYRRSAQGATLVVLLGFADAPRHVTLDGLATGRVLIASHGPTPGTPVDLAALDLEANQALVVELDRP